MQSLPSLNQSLGVIDGLSRPLRYIENKPVNHSIVQEFLELSARANQWSNFGPVSHLLEEKLAQILDVPDHLSVIACANATVAMHALISMYHHLHGRSLRWVTSAFGFYSSVDGILHTADMIDCNRQGMLDLDLLDPDDFDGFIVTNIFGRYPDLAPYEAFARQHQKIMMIDGAMAFHPGGHGANECISLHHTKPWGFGEGGCAIVDKEHADLYRDMLSFGHHSPDAPINRLAINGKISDIACAYILMRLSDHAKIRDAYQDQYSRIATIGLKLGLTLLGGEPDHPGVPANVPFLFPHSVHLEAEPRVPARKYYYPLANTSVATDIYQRIINVACHSEMARLPDGAIEEFLGERLK